MMKELYVHAGLPKNGSSALQVFFAKYRTELLECGVEYFNFGEIEQAKHGDITSGNGSYLSRSLLSQKHEAYYQGGENLYKDLLSSIEINNKKIGLISSEFFAVTPLQTIENWKTDLQSLGVMLKYIYYTRRQDQFLMSSYMQRVKRHGFMGSPGEFMLDNYKSIHFLNYYGYSNQLENILGKDNVIPLIYESAKNHQKGLIGHFINKLLGEVPEWIELDPVVNTSPGPLETKLMLMANKYSPRMRFSDFIIQDSITSGRSGKYKLHNIVKPEIIAEVMSTFSDKNKQFEKKYCHGNKFPPLLGEGYIDLEHLSFSPEEVLDIVAGFLVRIDHRLTRLESS